MQPFEPLEKGNIGMYVCGITVYDLCHLGHARLFVAFDLIVRYLRFAGWKVRYVRNITDIDDKIIQRAAEENRPWQKLTEEMTAAMHQDMQRLGLIAPDSEPKATDYIEQMQQLIGELIQRGNAYAAEGSVYFSVDSWSSYGRLNNRDIQPTEATPETGKRNEQDFALWKQSKPDEPSWPSPWGDGRPGWHIECSAMSMQQLGQVFDIHGGGVDLKFPHHENEIAQSCCATDADYARYWMHVGPLSMGEDKMSKSLGNFILLREVLDEYPAEAVYFFLAQSHYRSPLVYTEDALHQAGRALRRLYAALYNAPPGGNLLNEILEAFHAAMGDDFSAPKAFALLFKLARKLNRCKINDTVRAADLAETLRHLGGVFAILQQDPQEFLRAGVDADEVENLIKNRDQARDDKDFAKADAIRDQLHAMGIVLMDSSEGTRWEQRV